VIHRPAAAPPFEGDARPTVTREFQSNPLDFVAHIQIAVRAGSFRCEAVDARTADVAEFTHPQQRVAAERTDMPIIFITGHGDVPMTVQAMKAGAVEFLTKPFSDEALLNAIRHAIERSETALGQERELQVLQERYAN